MASLSKLLLVAAACGVGGWALENAFSRAPRSSKAFADPRTPFLPVYAAGGALVALAAPHLASQSLPVRFAAYAASLSALELAACGLDRSMQGQPSWSYASASTCVDLPHALAWGVLGLGVEALVT